MANDKDDRNSFRIARCLSGIRDERLDKEAIQSRIRLAVLCFQPTISSAA